MGIAVLYQDKPVAEGVKIIRTDPGNREFVLEETVSKVKEAPDGGHVIFTKVDAVHRKKS